MILFFIDLSMAYYCKKYKKKKKKNYFFKEYNMVANFADW